MSKLTDTYPVIVQRIEREKQMQYAPRWMKQARVQHGLIYDSLLPVGYDEAVKFLGFSLADPARRWEMLERLRLAQA